MSTAEQFFTAQNARMCILYEYIRGLTPRETRIEFKKAKQDVELKTIMGWYTRFKMGHFGMEAKGRHPVNINQDDLKVGLNDKDEINFDTIFAALEKESQKVLKFDFKFFEANSLGFVDVIKKIAAAKVNEGDTKIEYVVQEMEIFVKNDAQPKHIFIGIEYFEKRNGIAQCAETDMLEIYHCDNGVVLRRGKHTKLLEGDDYEYISVAAAACSEILFKICHKQVRFLKIGADRRDDNAEQFFKSFTDSFNKRGVQFPSEGTSTRLIHFGVNFNLKTLAIYYDDKTFKREDAKKMREMFREASAMNSCYFHNETFDEAAIKSSLEIHPDSQESTNGLTTIRVAPQRIFMERTIYNARAETRPDK